MSFIRLSSLFLLIYATYLRCDEVKLLDYVCTVTEKILKAEVAKTDVAIRSFNSKMPPEFLDEVTKCISKHSMVMMTDFSKRIEHKNLRKAQLIVIVTDEFNQEALKSFFEINAMTPVLDHMAKLMIISSQPMEFNKQIQIFRSFSMYGFLKMLLISRSSDNTILALTHTSFSKLLAYKNNDNIDVLFPDVLKDLHGYTYRVIVYDQYPRVISKEAKIHMTYIYFMNAIAKKQNAQVSYIFLTNLPAYSNIYINRKMDFTFNTRITNNGLMSYPKLLTYEETSYCALIPRSDTRIFKLILTRPFNWMIWLAFGLSVISFAVVWRLFKGNGAVDSVWLLLCGIMAFFLGQSISFRNNRRILVFILQLFIFTVMILGTLYQGELTALMIEPAEEQKLSTFDELYDSNLKIFSSETFESKMKHFDNYERIRPRINATLNKLDWQTFNELVEIKGALIMPCDVAESCFEYNDAAENYYMLDQRILKHYIRLDASYLNPFLEKVQLFMDWSFEGGLQQAWKLFMRRNVTVRTHDERQFLELKDFFQVFAVLGIGLLLSFSVFLVEIFYHKYSENLYMRWIFMKDEMYIRRIQRRNQRLRIVRQVNVVQPPA